MVYLVFWKQYSRLYIDSFLVCSDAIKQKTRFFLSEKAGHKPGNNLLSHGIVAALPSAVEGLTGVFGMGTSVSPHLWKPE